MNRKEIISLCNIDNEYIEKNYQNILKYLGKRKALETLVEEKKFYFEVIGERIKIITEKGNFKLIKKNHFIKNLNNASIGANASIDSILYYYHLNLNGYEERAGYKSLLQNLDKKFNKLLMDLKSYKSLYTKTHKEFQIEILENKIKVYPEDSKKSYFISINDIKSYLVGKDTGKDSYVKSILEFVVKGSEEREEEDKIIMKFKKDTLNQILYGPPGTGKTYNTINKALEIVDNEFYSENKPNEFDDEATKKRKREVLKKKFDKYRNNGQIEMVTFHQSYGYEEFVEGIKAETTENESIKYEVKPGIFKKLCEEAQQESYQVEGLDINPDARVWKISLGGTGRHKIKDKCFRDGEIRIGWEAVKEIRDEVFQKLGSNDQNTIINFVENMNIGDIVASIYSQNEIDGIGIIEGDYEGLDSHEHYNKTRKVKWLLKDKIIDFKKLNGDIKFTQKTVYDLFRVKSNEIIKLINDNAISIDKKESNLDKNYVLIIDEINRGNISKIFGELITLIEKDKRLGGEEAAEITLPYSGKRFGVPDNLYILGTMNTADRSIALLDTALRRRFDFEEMMPNPFLDDISKDIEGIDLQRLLETINKRIEYLYDRDHTIGHAYFIGVDTIDKLDNVMRNKVIPLLQEYFYDDWEKIQIVLGDHKEQNLDLLDDDRFIVAKELKGIDILGFNHGDIKGESISYTINSKFPETAYMFYEEG